LRRDVKVCVALPTDYASSTNMRYPTLYFLHGLFENERSWSERGTSSTSATCTSTASAPGAMVAAHPFGGFNMSGTDSKAGGPDYLLLFLQVNKV
jgi:hypothetical protein